MQNFILNFSLNFFISNIILGCKAFGQLKFWYRAFLASGILSVGILAYGIFSILFLACSILAMHLDCHSQIIITASSIQLCLLLAVPSIHLYNIPITGWPVKNGYWKNQVLKKIRVYIHNCTYPRINFKSPWGCGLVLGWVWLSEGPHFRPNSNLLITPHWWY